MTRYWLDCEFIEDGSTIDLISIGLVSEDGRELYLQSHEFEASNSNEWVRRNVFPHLKLCPYTEHGNQASGSPTLDLLWQLREHSDWQSEEFKRQHADLKACPWRTREQIRDEVKAFVDAGDSPPEFVAWCGSYDHVVLCQLFGKMIDQPNGWPYHIHDLQCILCDRGITDDQLPQQESGLHNALEDARHIKRLWEWLHREEPYLDEEKTEKLNRMAKDTVVFLQGKPVEEQEAYLFGLLGGVVTYTADDVRKRI